MKYYIGVELGVRNIIVGVVDKYGKMLRKEAVPTLKDRGYSEIIKDIVQLALKVTEEEDIDFKSIKYFGVGCPGIPNKHEGTIVRNYILGFVNTPIRAELQKHINLPVYVENDANCAALAESVAGAAEDIDFSVTIKLGVGIGGGIIINNKIYSGFNFAGAELGHMVIAHEGELCTCGRRGCWEAYASATALVNQTKKAAYENPESLINIIVNNDLDKINELTAFEAAKQGDKVGKLVVQKYIEYLVEGIVNIMNIFMPEVIILSGELSKLGDNLIKPLTELAHKKVYSKEVRLPSIKVAETGSAAIVIGAAMLGRYMDR